MILIGAQQTASEVERRIVTIDPFAVVGQASSADDDIPF